MTCLRARLPRDEGQPCPKRKLPKRNPSPSLQRRSRIMSLRYRSSRAPAGRWRTITRGTTQRPHREQAVSAHGGLHLRTSRRKISSSVHVAGRRVRAGITLIRNTSGDCEKNEGEETRLGRGSSTSCWNVRFWPKADIPIALTNVRFRGRLVSHEVLMDVRPDE
jgi:hypothetical protein